jgi:5-methylcytosine-specific restriction endonuclease McrA
MRRNMRGVGYILKKEEIAKAIEQSINMAEAARLLGVPPMTFKGWAIKYGIYDPKPQKRKRLCDIKKNVHDYVIRENLLENKCNICGLHDYWNGKPIVLHLHHIDGNRKNNDINNLEMLCPNCHSQTVTYGGKNSRKNASIA